MDKDVTVERRIGAVDSAVIFSSLAVSALIGLYFRFSGGKQKTTQEYLFGDKSQKIIPVGISLIASMMSSISLLGVSAEVYFHSIQFVVINIGYIIVTPIIAYLYLPVYYRIQCTSVFEYLEKRFGCRTRFTASAVYFLQTVLYMGIVLYAPALTFEALTGLSQSTSILAVGIVCTFYSTLGGMKAVIATDIFQCFLMFMALFIVIFTAVIENKGWGPILNEAYKHGRLQFFNFDLDPTTRHSFWSLVIGGGSTYLTLFTVNQTQVQRYMTLGDLKSGVLTLFIALIIAICLNLCISLSGLAIFSKYSGCDPIKSHRIARGDQLMPLYVSDVVGSLPGLTGFFVSGIFSAGLSTISAILNSLAAVTLEDYIKPIYQVIYKKPYPDDQTLKMTKTLVLLFGCLCILLAFLAKFWGGILQASLTILGVVGGPLLGIFTLGMFVPFANELGGLSGLIISLFVTLWIGFGGPKPPVTSLPTSVAGCSNGISIASSVNSSFYSPFSVHKNMLLNEFDNFSLKNSVQWNTDLVLTKILDNSPELDSEFHSVTKSSLLQIDSEPNYPYIYRISYLWYVIIGFFLTMFIGVIVSLITSCFSGGKITQLDPDLFSPPVADYLKQQYWIKQNKEMSVSETLEMNNSVSKDDDSSYL